MSKFLKIISENNPNNSKFIIKVLDASGGDTGYPDVEINGVNYLHEVWQRFYEKHMNRPMQSISKEEDNEVISGAETLGNIGDKEASKKLEELKNTAKMKRAQIVNKVTGMIKNLRDIQ